MPLRGLYQYVSSLTRPVTIQFKNRGRGSGCDADNDATDPVPIRWFPNPPGNETAQKPGEWKGCAADNDATDPVPIHWFPNPPGIAHLRGRK